MNALIVIPCLNEEKNIERLIQQFLNNNKDYGIRIVVVDGGSTDNTKKIINVLAKKHSNVLYLHNQKRLQSVAINQAVEKFA